MSENLREHYFTFLKLILCLALIILELFDAGHISGAPILALLILAFFIGAITAFDFLNPKKRVFLLIMEGVLVFILWHFFNHGFIILLSISLLDAVSARAKAEQYACYLFAYLPLFLLKEEIFGRYLLAVTLLMVIYFQNRIVIRSYQNQLLKEELAEEKLKRSLNRNQIEFLETIRKNRMDWEHQMLNEKAQLSQALHDKLGHSINGSLYQLEACRLLVTKEPDKSKQILDKVIGNLRSSMDEIRLLLRQEKPHKHKLALLSLKDLCADCKENYNIDARLEMKGDIMLIPDSLWEIILDNTFEAFSNALKYAKCTEITLNISVFNKVVRCSVRDNGIGAKLFEDGMGIAGMRSRMRRINGVLDFESRGGFEVNMIMPMEK